MQFKQKVGALNVCWVSIGNSECCCLNSNTIILHVSIEKRNRLVKGRYCADGQPHKEYISRLEVSTSIVKTHALFLSCLIAAIERRCVVVVDIQGAFLLTDWPKDTPDCYSKFEGVMTDIIYQIHPEYKKYSKCTNKRDRDGNRKQYLVRKRTKGVYGTLLGKILFYNKLKRVLEGLVFEVNNYNKYTFNKMICGIQCSTIHSQCNFT